MRKGHSKPVERRPEKPSFRGLARPLVEPPPGRGHLRLLGICAMQSLQQPNPQTRAHPAVIETRHGPFEAIPDQGISRITVGNQGPGITAKKWKMGLDHTGR
jgi:hypothetical protein